MIEPSTFDAIVIGTGLPESILAAAIASSGKTVLHLDAYEGYLSPWASLSFSQLSSFEGHLPKPNFSSEDEEELNSPPMDAEYTLLQVKDAPPLYSAVKVSSSHDDSALGRLNRYSLDLAGPKVVFCAGPLVEALIKAQADHHVRFKAVEASFIWRDGKMNAVPASRADIFRDKTLSLSDKRFLMRFFKLVTDYTENEDGELAAEDLDRPFVELLRRQQLPISIQEIILYAIALVDDDQEQSADAATLLSTNDGLQTLALYLASANRFPDAPGAFLYPMYGHGDLPQAFCRCAAVRGAIYVLRMPVVNLLLDKESGDCKGVKIATGQVLLSDKVIASPTFCVENSATPDSTPTTTSSTGAAEESAHSDVPNTSGGQDSTKVARCLCITDQSLQPGLSTVLVIFPPNSLNGRKSQVVRALQLGSTSDVCPDGKFIVQLSVKCSDGTEAEETLQAVKESLFREDDSESDGELVKPKLLWSFFLVQEVSNPSQAIRGLKMCIMPDGTIDYRSMMKCTETIFRELYPEIEFFPKLPATSTSEQGDEDADEIAELRL
jgi:RAB protein geranylgeranyltransferase component A